MFVRDSSITWSNPRFEYLVLIPGNLPTSSVKNGLRFRLDDSNSFPWKFMNVSPKIPTKKNAVCLKNSSNGYLLILSVSPSNALCMGKKRAGEWDNFNPNLCLGNGLALEGPFGVGKIFGWAPKMPLVFARHLQTPVQLLSVFMDIYLYIISIWVFPTPKSSILIGISIINHPFGGTTILGNTHI